MNRKVWYTPMIGYILLVHFVIFREGFVSTSVDMEVTTFGHLGTLGLKNTQVNSND